MGDIALALADRFMAAALEPSQWLSTLQAFAEATGSARGQLIGIGHASATSFNWVNDFPEHAFGHFMEIDGSHPEVSTRVAASQGVPLMTIRSEAHYRATRLGKRSDVYADFCREYDLPYGCQTKLIEDAGRFIGLAVLRTKKDRPTTQVQRALFATVAPQVRSAVRVQMALENDGRRLIGGALDHISTPIFLCAVDGRPCTMTPTAEALLSEGRLCLHHGRLSLADRRDDMQLERAMARHMEAEKHGLTSLFLPARGGRPPLILDVIAAPRQPWDFGFEPRILIIVRGHQKWHGSAETILRSFYRLSPAEADIALRLGRGQSRQAIADERRASLATVRSQIKAIFEKLNVTREIELAVMVGQLLKN